MSSELDRGVASLRARACDFLRLRFSRNASFSRAARWSLAVFAAGSLPSLTLFVIADLLTRAAGPYWPHQGHISLTARVSNPSPRLRASCPCGKDRPAL